MQFTETVIMSLFSAVTLFLLAKLMGAKQISQMTMFDYVNGITIGSIAAEIATNLEREPIKPLTAMIVFALLNIVFSALSSRSIFWRKIIAGRSVILYDKGKLSKKNLKKCKLDTNEFLTLCRISGFFDLEDIETAIFEHNGVISFLPKSDRRPIEAGDLNLEPKQETILPSFIIDGKILSENVKQAGLNDEWLLSELKRNNTRAEEVFLATYTGTGLNIYKKSDTVSKNDPFQ